MITRRALLRGLAGGGALGAIAAGYAGWIEPTWRLEVAEHRLRPPRWPHGLTLRVALVSDLHANEPFMPLRRVMEIVARVNSLAPDLILLLGDYAGRPHFAYRHMAAREVMPLLADLRAPLGRHAILGNHDYWDGVDQFRSAMAASGIPLLENDAAPISTPQGALWLAGTGSMLAYVIPGTRRTFRGLDDLPGTLARVPAGAPTILMAHEPDQFVKVPANVSLTVSGHTHGGQVRLMGWSPIVPSAYGQRFAYGHVVEDGRHLVVSGGLGMSNLPVRLGMPPEITLLTLG